MTEDLRVIRTRKAIQQAFKDMLTEMDFGDITISSLSERAGINRKTFYLHYSCLGDLLSELQDRVVDEFLKMSIPYDSIKNIKLLVRYFFEVVSHLEPCYERLVCSDSFSYVWENVNRRIMDDRSRANRDMIKGNEDEKDIVFMYFGSVTTQLYRLWVKSGKKLGFDDVVALSEKLICYGMDSVIGK